jgi:hypothetical protein
MHNDQWLPTQKFIIMPIQTWDLNLDVYGFKMLAYFYMKNDNNNDINISITQIANDTGISVGKVRRQLLLFLGDGILTCIHEPVPSLGKAGVYIINSPKYWIMP